MKELRRVLFLAGGKWQVPLIQFLQSSNYSVTVVDPYNDSSGVKIADEHLRFDVRDVEGIYDAVKDENFSFVVSDQSDVACEAVASLSRAMETRSNTPEAVEYFWNKSRTFALASSLGIKVPAQAVFSDFSLFLEGLSDFNFPVVVKPADSQSSRGVSLIESDDEVQLRRAFDSAYSESKVKQVLLQQCVKGKEVTVEGYASGGRHHCLALSSKRHVSFGIANELLYPADISEVAHRSCVQNVNSFVEESGLEFGITHAEFIVDEDSGLPHLIEIACRGGGTLISSDIVPWCSGVNVYEWFLQDLAGEVVERSEFPLLERSAVLSFFCFKPGKVRGIQGVLEAKALSGVHSLELEFSEGDTLLDPTDDRSRHGYVIIFADSREEVCDKLERVKNLVSVEY